MCSCCHPWCSHLHFGYNLCQPCYMKGLHASCYMCQCFHLPHPCPGQCSLTHHTHCQYLRLWLFTSVPCTFHLISLYLFSMSLTFWTRVPISYGLHRFEDALYLIIFLSLSALMLAPPSGLSAIVFGQLTCLVTKLVQETKKDRKVST